MNLKIKLIIFDLDGVIYRGRKLLSYSAEIISNLRQRDIKIFFFTNNSTRSRYQYKRQLNRLGIPCDISEIMTSSYATALYFQEKVKKNAKILVLGGKGIIIELKRFGFNPIRITISNYKKLLNSKFDYVVVGLDPTFNYKKLAVAQKAILEGAQFIATNRDGTFPAENRILPGGGTAVVALEVCTHKKPLTIGKPAKYSMNKILKITQVNRNEAMIVGDRYETDILLGKKMGLITALVLTGVTKKQDLKNIPSRYYPDLVVENLEKLWKITSSVIK